jgi:hypothetical protein
MYAPCFRFFSSSIAGRRFVFAGTETTPLGRQEKINLSPDLPALCSFRPTLRLTISGQIGTCKASPAHHKMDESDEELIARHKRICEGLQRCRRLLERLEFGWRRTQAAMLAGQWEFLRLQIESQMVDRGLRKEINL